MELSLSKKNIDFLLVGGGYASVTAAETLRREGAKGSILIISADKYLPYRRPDLSKAYLLGKVTEAQILIHPESFYKEKEIEIALNTSVVFVCPEEKYIKTSDGQQIFYGKLLLATGSKAKDFTGDNGSLPGIYKLRSQADCELVRQQAKRSKHALVCGGDFKGLEIVMSFSKMGLHTAVVEQESKLLPHLEADGISDFFKVYAQENGVKTYLEDAVVAFEGKGKLEAAITRMGHRIPCDLAVLCIGEEPNTGYLQGSSITTQEGRIIVDELLRTNHPDVFAAGDITDFYDIVFRRRRHIEHWDNAQVQGHLAAVNMLDKRVRYDEVSYFYCEMGDVGFSMLGDPTDAPERIERGSLSSRSYAQFYMQNNLLKSVFAMGLPATEIRQIENLIRYRVNLQKNKDKLASEHTDLSQLGMQNVLILQGGGALGAFECGVVKALEEKKIFPDIVAGISIGALNGGIVASNPHHATQALESFWSELKVISPPISYEPLRKMLTSSNILQFGVPKFFRPNWFKPFSNASGNWFEPAEWTGFYDTSPMRTLIQKYVDFSFLKTSPVRLLVGAVNVLNGELHVFDSYVDDLTPDHLLASGSLPPGFSWTYVDGQPYWDGGVVSNSPLDLVFERCGTDGKKVYMIDLYAGERSLPKNIMEVMTRRDEIVYSDRIRNDLKAEELKDSYRALISTIMNALDPVLKEKFMQRPQFIKLMGDGSKPDIIRFLRSAIEGELSSRDYDFSDLAIEDNQKNGYEIAVNVLRNMGAGK